MAAARSGCEATQPGTLLGILPLLKLVDCVAEYGGVAMDDRAILAIRAPDEPVRLRAAA